MGDTQSQTRNTILELLQGLPPEAGRVACPVHAGREATVFCSRCGRAGCCGCMELVPREMDFVCADCTARATAFSPARAAAVLKMPFFYVGLSLAGALVAYTLGVGNPDEGRMAALDRGRKWYLQDLGGLWLRQGARTRARAEALLEQGKTSEGEDWAELSARALRKAAAALRDAPVEEDLLVGSATMLGKAGATREAYDRLREIGGRIGPEHPAHPAYLYERGKLAETLRLAGDGSWERLRQLVPAGGGASARRLDRLIDQVIASAGENRIEAAFAKRVRRICGTDRSARILLAALPGDGAGETVAETAAKEAEKKRIRPVSGREKRTPLKIKRHE